MRRALYLLFALSLFPNVFILASHGDGLLGLEAPQLKEMGTPNTALSPLTWRSIGPANMGGRVTDIAGVPGNPAVFYVAAAGGGLFKTTNAGTTFRPVFDDQEVLDIGAIAIAPSDPRVIWVGTGEGNVRQSAAFGDGVYRSRDGGETWVRMGLADSERIARIRIDPRDPNTVYVAALGHEWGPNEERGLFKTTDGGNTWSRVLYRDKDTGCSDVDLDPVNPLIVYAGMYTYRRLPWRFDGGGRETGLYRSMDGGVTWAKLTNGLPKGPIDRVGVAVAPSHPETVYMVTEAKEGGVLFRSDDRGNSWQMVNDDPTINFRPFYYSDIHVDPTNPLRVYSLSGGLVVSEDGGHEFSQIGRGVHGDHQALWIDPLNPNRLLEGSDGGYQVSHDRGQTWDVINNVAISEFYHISVDNRQPYYVCGGLQDNSNWCGPVSTQFAEGIRKDDWFGMCCHDGIFAFADPRAPHLVYSDFESGYITLTDTRTGATRVIHPYPVEMGSSGNAVAGYKYRFNWEAPLALSPHDPAVLYFGGNVLFKTVDRGESWEVIGPDLTTNDKSKQQSSGGPVAQDNTGAEFYCTILTIAESPAKAGVIWVGTDDGNVQVSKDAGKTWTNVVGRIPGLAPNSWISMIEASRFDAGTAYVVADRHRNDDFGPYIFQTTDYGQTWRSLKSDLPAKGYAHVVREDPKNRQLLYLGTHLGVFASWDSGNHWVSIRHNLPAVPVYDLVVHPRDNDLLMATHGRGLYVLDNIAPLQELEEAKKTETYLFDVRPATRYQLWRKDASLGTRTFAANNPPYGALIDYYLAMDVAGDVIVTITDKSGKQVREIRGPGHRAGVNRLAWDLRYDPAAPPASDRRNFGTFGTHPVDYRVGDGPLVVPGEYNVTLKASGKQLTRTVRVTADPRSEVRTEDLRAQVEALLVLRGLTTKVNAVIDRTADLTGQLQRTRAGSASAQSGIEAALARVKVLRARLTRPNAGLQYREGPKLREDLWSMAADLNAGMAAPTAAQRERLQALVANTDAVIAEMNAIVTEVIPKINELLGGQSRINPGEAIR